MDYFRSTNNPNSCESSSMVENNKDMKKKKNGKRNKRVMKLSTDPQSVAARERRHRISNRFKILQSLVPGGSKMDTVSMLDEAIHYVKYLKSQIWLHENVINFNNINADDDDDLSSAAFAEQEALFTYSQQQQQQQQQPEFFGAVHVQPSPPSVPLPNCLYQLGEGTMYFDGYMQ